MTIPTLNQATMQTEVIVLTPNKARELLEKNTCNRPPRQAVIDDYAHLMSTGKWYLTHQGIAISKTGKILDGQHRLLACVKANIPIDIMLTTGLDDSLFSKVDVGFNRSIGAMMAIAGINNYNRNAAGITLYLAMKKKGSKTFVMGGSNHKREYAITADEVIEEYKLHPETYDQIDRMADKYSRKYKILPARTIYGFIAFLHLERNHNLSLAEHFFNKVYTIDLDYSNSNAPKVLFDHLIRNVSGTTRLKPLIISAMIVKAWNLYYKNKDCKLLKFDIEREQFPIVL